MPDTGKHGGTVFSQIGLGIDFCTDPAQRPIQTGNPVLAAPAHAPPRCVLHALPHTRAIVLHDLQNGERRIGFQVFGRDAHEVAHPLADKREMLLAVPHMPLEHHARNGVGDVAQARFGRLGNGFHALALGNVGADGDVH